MQLHMTKEMLVHVGCDRFKILFLAHIMPRDNRDG